MTYPTANQLLARKHKPNMASPKIFKDLGDGLVMRAATPDDSEALAKFHSRVFKDEESDSEAWWIAEWGKDLLTKPHPTLNTNDIIIIEDTEKSRIASSTIYLNQQWTYAGIPFNIGRPEIVGTAPEYRNRGLIREQFNLMHQWADERGHEVLVIEGIPYYYRQFGYEMALSTDGGRYSNMLAMPRWNKDEKRPYRMRDAIPEDIEFITKTLKDSTKRSLISPLFKPEELRYMTFDLSKRSAVHYRTGILCKSDNDGILLGEPVGIMMYGLVLAIDQAVILRLEMSEPRYWRLALPSFLRELEEKARLAKDEHEDPEREIKKIRVDMQPDHPAFIFDDGALGPTPDTQYAWYVRVPDLPRFIKRITPAIEKRIENSIHAKFTGKLEIVFSRETLIIEFNHGLIKSVEMTKPANRTTASASFPELTFLQLLFGRRSVDQLLKSFPDCSVKSKAEHHLLQTMFPKQTSDLSLTLK